MAGVSEGSGTQAWMGAHVCTGTGSSGQSGHRGRIDTCRLGRCRADVDTGADALTILKTGVCSMKGVMLLL